VSNDMDHQNNDERRDAELDLLRDSWQAPAPSDGFHERVMAAYKTEFQRGRRQSRRFPLSVWLAFAGVAAVCMLVVGIVIGTRVHHGQPGQGNGIGSGNGTAPGVVAPYQPVHQPQFVVISEEGR